MDNLIERNKSYKEFKHSNDIIKLKQSSERHDKNMYEEQKKLEEKALKIEEKILRRYMTFYYYKKNIEKEQKLKNTRNQHKLIEKCEKLEEIDKNEKIKTKEIIRKLDTIERKKNEILKHKSDEFNKFKNKRKDYNNKCKLKRERMTRELSDIRLDILDYQSSLLNRNNEKIKLAQIKRNQSTGRTLNDQLNFKKNLGLFFKKIEAIKSESVMRKSPEDRRKIYIQNKKQEAERKKQEEEERLINRNLK